MALFRDLPRERFEENIQSLRQRIQQDQHHMAVGFAWSDQFPFELDALIGQADHVMYQDKRDYYRINGSIPGIDRRKSDRRPENAAADKSSLFYHFLASTYHDMEFLFQSISQQNTVSYFYFGDMAKDLFYISDNMRDEFGFRSNVVPGLLKEWAKRIPSPQYRDMYRRQIQTMLQEKRTVHDLRYQIRNAAGTTVWIRCFGLMQWSEDKTKPLFFAGRVTHQDDDFVVDPVTNFPRVTAMFGRMDQLRQTGRQCLAIGFSLNSITELNNARSRTYSDHLVSNIADELMKNLMGKMSFYRLEGMRCLALVDPACAESREELVHQIREIVEAGYQSYEEFSRQIQGLVINSIHPDDREFVKMVVAQALAKGDQHEVQYRMKRRDGTDMWVHDIGRKTVADNGREAIISVLVDISEQINAKKELEKAADKDPLTGLFNRKAGQNRIENAMHSSGGYLFVIMDLDNFKQVNDLYGHQQGDRALHEFAALLTHTFRRTDILFRLGGDEFGVFFSAPRNLGVLERKLNSVVQSYQALTQKHWPAARSSVSIGGVYGQLPREFSELYRTADQVLYEVKNAGKGAVLIRPL